MVKLNYPKETENTIVIIYEEDRHLTQDELNLLKQNINNKELVEDINEIAYRMLNDGHTLIITSPMDMSQFISIRLNHNNNVLYRGIPFILSTKDQWLLENQLGYKICLYIFCERGRVDSSFVATKEDLLNIISQYKHKVELKYRIVWVEGRECV